MPASADALYVNEACSVTTTAWLRSGLPCSASEVLRGSVRRTWLSVSEVRWESVFIRAAA